MPCKMHKLSFVTNIALIMMSQAPNFFSVNSERFSRSANGQLLYNGWPVQVNQVIAVDTSGSGAASAWNRYAQVGDMFFVYCKRGVGCDWRRDSLPTTLEKRGIYAIGKSTSGPYNFGQGRIAIDVRIVALLDAHVPQYEINGNPRTYWATPYRGNRNDAIQRHPDDTNAHLCPHPQQGLEFLKMIVNRNPGLISTIIAEWPYFQNRIP